MKECKEAAARKILKTLRLGQKGLPTFQHLPTGRQRINPGPAGFNSRRAARKYREIRLGGRSRLKERRERLSLREAHRDSFEHKSRHRTDPLNNWNGAERWNVWNN